MTSQISSIDHDTYNSWSTSFPIIDIHITKKQTSNHSFWCYSRFLAWDSLHELNQNIYLILKLISHQKFMNFIIYHYKCMETLIIFAIINGIIKFIQNQLVNQQSYITPSFYPNLNYHQLWIPIAGE